MVEEIHEWNINGYDDINTSKERHIIMTAQGNASENAWCYIALSKGANGYTWGIASGGHVGKNCSLSSGTSYVHSREDMVAQIAKEKESINRFLKDQGVNNPKWTADWKNFKWKEGSSYLKKFKES